MTTSFSATTPVYAWGFSANELADLRARLGITEIGVLDPDAHVPPWDKEPLVIVHAEHRLAFEQAAERNRRADGRLLTAVLSYTGDVPPTEIDWEYYDASFAAEDETTLRGLIEAPQQFAAAELVDELPVSFFSRLDRPIPTISTAKLPLSEEAKDLLSSHPACRNAFNRAAEERLIAGRLVRCPDIAAVRAYAQTGEAATELVEHVKQCPLCGAEYQMLRDIFAPSTSWDWLTAQLPRGVWSSPVGEAVSAAPAHGEGRLPDIAERATRALTGLIRTFMQGNLIPAPVGLRGGGPPSQRGSSMPPNAEEREALVTAAAAQLLKATQHPAGNELPFTDETSNRLMTIGYRGESDIVIQRVTSIDAATGIPRRFPEFRAEIRRGDEIVWWKASEAGRVVLPVPELTEAIEAGADHFVIAIDEETAADG